MHSQSRSPSHIPRHGKVLVLFLVMIPAVFGTLALVIDGSRLMTDSGVTQHVADAAAIAAAASLARGESSSLAIQCAQDSVQTWGGLGSFTVNVSIPPVQGSYAGKAGYAAVLITRVIPMSFLPALNGTTQQTVSAIAVAGQDDATAGAAIVVLDPNPPPISPPTVLGLTLPAMPSHHLGGLEVLGLGSVKVDGAVLVNTDWGGEDEDELPAGWSLLSRSAVSCTPLISLTRMQCRDLRVVGGVDDKDYYSNITAGEKNPVHANAKPVPDPLLSLPVPTTAVDPANVSATIRGGVTVVGVPLIGLPTTLRPGVYDYIQVVSGRAIFEPGVYIIRGKNPLTDIPLQIIGGEVTAVGVMFYITDSASYSATSGGPDANDGETVPAATSLGTVLPSAVLNVGLLGSTLSPITSPSSPFAGILIFQRRADRRIIVISRDTLLSGGSFSGTVYAKWGDVIFAGSGPLNARFVVGSMRFINILDCTIAPTTLLPSAQDVFLVQ